MVGTLCPCPCPCPSFSDPSTDRALLYYRLLVTDAKVCQRLFVGGDGHVDPWAGAASGQGVAEGELVGVASGVFAEVIEDETSRRLFEEFNSLAVIYVRPSAHFIKEKFQLVRTCTPPPPPLPPPPDKWSLPSTETGERSDDGL